MATFKLAAIKILQEKGEPMHYKDITEEALKQGLIDTSGATPEATMNAQISMEVKLRGEDSRFVRTAPGVFALNQTVTTSLEAEEQLAQAEEDEKVASSYTGTAGEHLICAKLLFLGFNASIMSVDTGLDVVAVKDGQTFGIQVKTANLSKYNVFVFDLRKVSFERHSKSTVFYVFVLHSASEDRFIILPFSELEKKVNEGAILEVGHGARYRVNIKERDGKIYLGNMDHDISYYLDNWAVIK